MIKVGRGQSDIHLGPKALAALGKILNLQGDPALFSITSLAERLEVNASTITRLARNLGYPGFGAFQEVLIKASISSPGEFYSKKAQQTLQSGDKPSLSKVSQLCHESQANTDRLIESFDTRCIRSCGVHDNQRAAHWPLWNSAVSCLCEFSHLWPEDDPCGCQFVGQQRLGAG